MNFGPHRVAGIVGALLVSTLSAACATSPGEQADQAEPTPANEAEHGAPMGSAAPPQPRAGTPEPGTEPGARDRSSGTTEPGAPPLDTTPPLGHAFVIFGTDTVVAEVAATFTERAAGLMNRTDIPANGGMLFVFETVEERSFWMKDTPLDLDVAFMEEGYRIFQIETMEANSLKLTDSEQPVFAALEVHGGWLAAHGVEVGDVADVVFRDD